MPSPPPASQLLRPEWFRGRAVIDVGCNEGLVTLAVAARYGARRMTGYDIDEQLVKRACRWAPGAGGRECA